MQIAEAALLLYFNIFVLRWERIHFSSFKYTVWLLDGAVSEQQFVCTQNLNRLRFSGQQIDTVPAFLP